jgi:hypothetical protein
MKASSNVKIFQPVLFVLLAAFLACGSDTPIQGFDLSNPDSRGLVDSTAIKEIDFELTYTDSIVPTGAVSSSLLLGSFNNVESRVLLRFNAIPDTAEITKATLILRTNAIIGDEIKTAFSATVHNVLEDWNELTVTDENFHHNYDRSPIAAAEILSVTQVFDENDSLIIEPVRFQFNEAGVALVNGWADTTDATPNYGMLIDFSNSTFIKSFFTVSNAANRPLLELEVMSGSVLDTVSVPVTQDAFIARELVSLPSGPLYVDNIFGKHAIVKFDLSAIRRESTVNRAQLELTVDQAHTFISESQFSFQVMRLLKPFTEPDSIAFDFGFAALATVSSTGSKITVSESSLPVFRRIVQDWVTGQVENHGLLIRTNTPGQSISRVAIVAAQLNPAEAPSLRIDFSIAPSIPNQN